MRLLLVQMQVQQRPVLLGVEEVKEQQQQQEQEVQKCLIEHYVESYDNQGFPKPSGYNHSVAPHFEHVLDVTTSDN